MIGRVQCVGNETSLLDCSHVTESHDEVAQCDPIEVAAVSCPRYVPSLQTVVHHQNAVCISTDISTVFAECVTGEVRFVDLSNNTEEDSRQGTIQICVNNVWGSVCSDNLLDDIDAQIFL